MSVCGQSSVPLHCVIQCQVDGQRGEAKRNQSNDGHVVVMVSSNKRFDCGPSTVLHIIPKQFKSPQFIMRVLLVELMEFGFIIFS